MNNISNVNGFTRTEHLLTRRVSTAPKKDKEILDRYDEYKPSSKPADGTDDTVTDKQTHKLTEADIKKLNEKYDVNNMTSNDRANLLKELKDMGVITDKEYSSLKYGAVPDYETTDGKLHFKYVNGKDDTLDGETQLSDTDWLSNYKKIAEYLTEQKTNVQSEYSKSTFDDYSKIYSKMKDILEQIADYKKSEV